MPCTRYRRNRRFGSCIKRCNHSRPMRCTKIGARSSSPATKLNEMPQDTNQVAGRCLLSRTMRRSCFGNPRPTNTIWGAAMCSELSIRSSHAGSVSKPRGGHMVPAMRSCGLRLLSSQAVASAVPGLPPSKKMEAPACAAAAESERIRGSPPHALGRGEPCRPPAQMSGIPSATTRSACETSLRTSADVCHWRKTSRFAGQSQPPCLADTPRSTWSMVPLSESAAKSSPINRTAGAAMLGNFPVSPLSSWSSSHPRCRLPSRHQRSEALHSYEVR